MSRYAVARDPRRLVSAAIWIAGAAVLLFAAATALGYLRGVSIRPLVGVETNVPGSAILVAAGLIAAGCAAVVVAALLGARDPRWAITYGVAVLVGVRLVAIVTLDARFFSDFATYWAIANGMLAGHGFWTAVPPGYPLLEAAAIAIGGDRVASGEVLNLLLSIVAGGAVYLVTARRWGGRAGAVALTAVAVMPSQVLFTVVLGTEVAYGAFLALVAWSAQRATDGRWVTAAGCGVLLGLSQYIRPTSQLLVPALALVFVVAASTRRIWLRPVLVFALAFALVVTPIVAWNATTLGRLSISASLYDKWTIYIGLNIPSDGQFSPTVRDQVVAAAGIRTDPELSLAPGAYLSDWRLADVRAFNDAAGDLIPERIRSNGLRSITMQPAKFRLMWQNADFPVPLLFGPASPQPDPTAAAIAALVTQAAWVLVLLGALLGLWRARIERPPEVLIVLVIILAAVAVHVFAEVQPRYHEYFVPLVCILAGAAAAPRRMARAAAPDLGASLEA